MTIYDAIELVKQPLLDIRKVVTDSNCIIYEGKLSFLLTKDVPIRVLNLFMSHDSNTLVCLIGYKDEGKLVTYDGNEWKVKEIRPK